MDITKFKNVINEKLVSRRFIKKGAYFIRESSELIIVLGIQKSNYSNSFYINLGYIITPLRMKDGAYRDSEGHVRSRFNYIDKEQSKTIFDVDDILFENEEVFNKILEENIRVYIDNVLTISDLVKLIVNKPNLLYQTTFEAKSFLGFK